MFKGGAIFLYVSPAGRTTGGQDNILGATCRKRFPGGAPAPPGPPPGSAFGDTDESMD